MDQFPVKQTLELEKSTSTGEKCILNLVKCVKYSLVNFSNFVYILHFDVPHFDVVVSLFARNTKVNTEFANFTGLYLTHFTIFCNQTGNFTKFRRLIDFPNSKVCLIGNWAIDCGVLSSFSFAVTINPQAHCM